MAKCEKCGSENVRAFTWKNYQKMRNEYHIICNECGNEVRFNGERWI